MIEGIVETCPSRYLAGLRAGRKISGLARAAFGRLFSAASAERRLHIEERLTIGPKKTLMLVNCAGRHFLVATSAETIAPIIEIRPLDEDGSPRANAIVSDQGQG